MILWQGSRSFPDFSTNDDNHAKNCCTATLKRTSILIKGALLRIRIASNQTLLVVVHYRTVREIQKHSAESLKNIIFCSESQT